MAGEYGDADSRRHGSAGNVDARQANSVGGLGSQWPGMAFQVFLERIGTVQADEGVADDVGEGHLRVPGQRVVRDDDDDQGIRA
ncbi:hypothetical protein F6W96_10660 [Nocardia terpenica]|uniref:Uncharacterized protein n=1 Tax=Nocardia terpenica TaxID=455432 RepID=A0A6G9YZP9_9NOCA|nr:hypothetical protein F6W96_10660 [Nocardia terpenica]